MVIGLLKLYNRTYLLEVYTFEYNKTISVFNEYFK